MSKNLQQFTEVPDLELIRGAAGLEQVKISRSGTVLKSSPDQIQIWGAIPDLEQPGDFLLCTPIGRNAIIFKLHAQKAGVQL